MMPRSQKGFTLVELLVATALSLIVLASVATFFRAQTKTVKGQESRMEANEYVLTVLDMVVREIRNTGYYPKAACDTTGGITSASTNGFSLQYDKNSDGACSGDDEVIAFAYDSANKNVTRNGQALTDGNATALQFSYYPQQTSGTLPAPYCISTGVPSGCSGTLSANFKSVQKITVSLTVTPKSTDSDFTGSPVTLSLTADLRNHGT
jgi:prepilin-type N-terminal cleavage/methylation domain-containing protein